MSDIKLYTPKEVAEILKLNRKTIYNYIESGRLKTVQFGREHRITEEELQRLVKTGVKN